MEKLSAIKANLKILLLRIEDLSLRKSAAENSKNLDEIFVKLEEMIGKANGKSKKAKVENSEMREVRSEKEILKQVQNDGSGSRASSGASSSSGSSSSGERRKRWKN